MMYGFNYERLTKITENQKPYRGSDNRFPLERRARNEKYFLVEMENGEKVYDVVYGKKYHHDVISKETFDTMKALGSDNVWESHEWDFDKQKYTGANAYYKRWTSPNILVRVRPDNTVEFTKKSYHQGDRKILSDNCSGRFVSDSRRGGLIYMHYHHNHKPKIMHAIYQGMRIACDSDLSVVPYEVELKKVDRRQAKESLKPYEDFFKVCEAMCKVIPYEQFKDTALSVVTERFGEVKQIHAIDSGKFLREAESCIQSAPLDALILYALGHDVNRFAWSFRWGRTHSNDNGDLTYQLYTSAKRRILKELYIAHKEVFKTYRVQGGEYFPASEWGTQVIVNGEVVGQL